MLTYIVFETSVCVDEREYTVVKELLLIFYDMSTTKECISSHLQKPIRELKIRRAAEYF